MSVQLIKHIAQSLGTLFVRLQQYRLEIHGQTVPVEINIVSIADIAETRLFEMMWENARRMCEITEDTDNIVNTNFQYYCID